MYQLVSILRACHMMVFALPRDRDVDACTRAVGGNHHGRTHSQPDDRAPPHGLVNGCRDTDLEARLLVALETLSHEGERIADGIGRAVVRNLQVMARIGVHFEEEVQRRYPEFPTRRGESGGKTISTLQRLVEAVDEGVRLGKLAIVDFGRQMTAGFVSY